MNRKQISKSFADAYHKVQSLAEHQGDSSLEELQGAVEYLLDTVKAARRHDAEIAASTSAN